MPVKQKRLAHSPCQSYNTPNPESRKTLPGRDWQTPAAPGQEAFLTPYLTTVGAGTRGNSGFKGAKKYLIPSEKHRKAPKSTTNHHKKFGSSVWDFCAREANSFRKDYQKPTENPNAAHNNPIKVIIFHSPMTILLSSDHI